MNFLILTDLNKDCPNEFDDEIPSEEIASQLLEPVKSVLSPYEDVWESQVSFPHNLIFFKNKRYTMKIK